MSRPVAGDDPVLAAIVARVAAAWDVPARALRSRRKGSRRIVQARQVAIYLAVVGLERMRKDVAPWFRRHPSVIGHSVRVVEDLRDDPAFDAALSDLEEDVARAKVSPKLLPNRGSSAESARAQARKMLINLG